MTLISVAEKPSFASEPVACPTSKNKEFDNFFSKELWPKVGRSECVKCHKTGGDADDTRFVLQDLSRLPPEERPAAARRNQDAFIRMAHQQHDGLSLLLIKAAGGRDHGGQEVLKPGSAGYRILQAFVRRARNPGSPTGITTVGSVSPESFFEDVTMLNDLRVLRKATLSLAGRLPTHDEIESLAVRPPTQLSTAAGRKIKKANLNHEAFEIILDNVLREDAFYERLQEGFNDIFLTLGVDGNPDQTVLSYEHFDKTRGWYQKHDLSYIEDEKERRDAGHKLSRDYRAALLGEPMSLVEHIVRNDHPFTEIVTANYIMVTPYTARGYGCFDEVKGRFKNLDDPFEYIPVRLQAL